MVIDIRHGDVIDWVRLSDDIVELFDVAVIPMTRCPTGIGPDSPELQDAITFEEAPRDGPCLTQLRGFAGCRIAKRLIFLGLTLDGRHYKVACERRILWRNKIISREISRTPASHNRVGRHYTGFAHFGAPRSLRIKHLKRQDSQNRNRICEVGLAFSAIKAAKPGL